MTYGWHDLLGIIGVVLILATYMLLQLEKLSAASFYIQRLMAWALR